MSNGNFIVQNGLQVGPLTIFASNGTIATTGTISTGGAITQEIIQNFSTGNAEISGGSINGTLIGNAVPSSGVFTTLDATTLFTTNFSTANAQITGGAISVASLSAGPINGSYVEATNFSTANAQISGGSISGVSLSLDSLNSTPIGAITPSTGAFTTLTASGNVAVNSSLYAEGIYDNSFRVVSLSSGAGNLTISGPTVTLTATGPGATTVGSATAIPIITTDAYGRIEALSTAPVSSTLSLAGNSGTGSVNLLNQTLTIDGGTDISTSVSGTTFTVNDTSTLASVTGRGATTSTLVTLNGGLDVTTVSASGNVAVNNTLYAQGIYDDSVRVVSLSSGAGNLTISGPDISLTATGPGATTVGSATAIPIITTDAYGRIEALSTAPVSSTLSLAGNSGTGSVNLLNQTLAIDGGTDISTSVSGQTITVNDTSTLASVTGRGASTSTAVTLNGGATISALTVTGTTLLQGNVQLTGPGEFVTNNLVVSGNLYVSGNTTTVNATAVTTNDLLYVAAANATTAAAANGAGLATPYSALTFNSGLTAWSSNVALYAPSLYDNNLRVITDVTPSAGTGISIGSLVATGPTASFSITNTGVTSLTASTGITVSAGTGAVTVTNTGIISAAAGTGISVTGTNPLTITNTGVTSLTAGQGITLSGSTGSVTVNNTGVLTLNAGTDISVSASTGIVTVNDTSTLASVTGRGATTASHIALTANGQGVGSASTLNVTGDITTDRGNNTGVVYLGNSGSNYIYYDGTNYNMPGGSWLPSGAGTYNLGSSTEYFNTVYGKATTALYADLAENYQADKAYQPGTVLMFGGLAEVTVADADTTRVAGVVSTNPATLMNGGLTGPNVVPVAFTGRVPCNVIGPVAKGDLMVSAGFGYAKVNNTPQIGQVIGKALQDYPINGKGVIEVVVGRF